MKVAKNLADNLEIFLPQSFLNKFADANESSSDFMISNHDKMNANNLTKNS